MEGDGLALATMEDDFLCGGFLHLETRGRLHLRDGVLARVESFALLVELDLAIFIRQDLPKVDALWGICRLTCGGVGDMKTRPLNRSAGDGIFLINREFRGLVVLKDQFLFVTGIQGDRLSTVGVLVRQVVRRGDGLLRDFIGAGGQPEGNGAVLPGGHIILVIAIHPFDGEYGAGDLGVRVVRVHLGDGELRLLEIIKNELRISTRPQPNDLGRFIGHHPRIGNRFFGHFVRVNRNARERRSAVLPSHHVLMIAMMNAFDFKGSAGDDFLGLAILLENGQVWQPLVHSGHGYGSAAVHISLIHMDNNRVLELGKRLRHGHLNEGECSCGDIGDGDGPIRPSGFCADELPILEDVKNGSLQRIFRII